MNIYLASSPVFKALCLGKIGCTSQPYGRRSTYLTGCPPGLTPSYDIDYDGIWETTATTKEELFAQEDEVHNHFIQYRMMRDIPGDSEWFNFHPRNPYDTVKAFMDTRPWVKRQVPLSDIMPSKKNTHTRYLRKQYPKNLAYLPIRIKRNAVLHTLQQPVISAIHAFQFESLAVAGYVIAPCGSGKTIMTCRGIRGIQRTVICCPSKQIQNQWKKTLIQESVFSAAQIHLVGGSGTTDPTLIESLLGQEDSYCVISTYMSSHLLVNSITPNTECLILDEAHHMAGIVAKEDKGEGRTRRLLLKATELGIKRLSLTYTPRFISLSHTHSHTQHKHKQPDTESQSQSNNYLTMDDETVFGSKIAELKIRHLIHQGVLPDYRLWTLRDEAQKGNGIIGKAECIKEAWNATEMVRGEVKPILHHLIVFASTTQEAKDIEAYFREHLSDIPIIRVEEGDALEGPIHRFTAAPRAILVNCFVLNEGVDIPCANAVAITYPKQSRGQITQMILRAGRWYESKPVFHVLIPTFDEDDLSGFEEVLSALASSDDQIRDEIGRISRSIENADSEDQIPKTHDPEASIAPECIMIDEFDATQEEIRRCFMNIRKKLFPTTESRRIQDLCVTRGWETSVDYATQRMAIPDLPEDPRPKNTTWYDYLHPTCLSASRLSPREFVKTVLDPHQLHVAHHYDAWRQSQPPSISMQTNRLPSVQHILDGYFGKEDTHIHFNTILETYGHKKTHQRFR